MEDVINSIDNMKALIGRRGGIARGNRFGVHITHPLKNQGVFEGKKSIVREGPRNSFSREVTEFKDFLQNGEDTYMLCSSVTLPGKRISTTEATHNHNLAKKPYSMATDEVTMTFLLTGDYYIKKYFDMWMNMVVDSAHHHYKTMYKKDYVADIEIRALQGNEDGIVGYGNLLENAYPIQMSQVELSNASDGLMELTITWEYDNWRALDIDKGFKDAYTEDKWTHPGERTSGQVPPMSGEETYDGPGKRTSGQAPPMSGEETYNGPGRRTSGVTAQEAYQSSKRGNMADYSASLAEAARKASILKQNR